ncbi:succinylglutamate desuccinylase [Marinobacter halodurans]|uniref:Succinylglutamate desuccinylase n=1 Tax=Marinobacter halodurans TaxID=2528979 RepID=A0ABY1ZJZ3_9GAMM|nr:succinylglutamate desuccinylase [Marinobacter halodurans]TBW52910.1 succinylglutamate desuccinylase [Marinobacter halodurans]
MSVRKTLFDGEPDWLAHTLSRAGQASAPVTAALPDGAEIRRLDTGILELVPASADDRRLIISAGIHGNETAPIEVLNGLLNELVDGRWQIARRTLLILGNPLSMVAGDRFVDHNMNRLFSGAHAKAPYTGSPEAARAAQLEQACREFVGDADRVSHYDLHTAIRPSLREKFALYPFVEGRKVPQDQCNFLLEAEVHTLLLQHKAGTTFSSFSSSHLGAESFTIELGKVRPFGQNDLLRFKGIENALRRVFRDEPAPTPPDADELTVFEVVHEILNTGDDFQFHVPDDIANFTPYQPGTVIWEDGATQYRVGDVPEAIIFPNRNVPVGQRVGLLVREKA